VTYYFNIFHSHEFDHLTPVVWKLLRLGHCCSLYLTKRFYEEDYRVKFLLSEGASIGGRSESYIEGLPHGALYQELAFGSPRYCKEWMDVHQGLYPRVLDRSYRVAVLLSNTMQPDCYRDATNHLARKITEDFDDVLVKQHTRLYDGNPTYNGDHVHTSEIIDAVDIVCVQFSSVVIEAFLKGKTVFHLGYTHSRPTEFARFCVEVHSYGDLITKLHSGYELPDESPKEWLRSVVGGDTVLQDYADSITR
jgi:hypothetical protein